jgi:hypothetical protein
MRKVTFDRLELSMDYYATRPTVCLVIRKLSFKLHEPSESRMKPQTAHIEFRADLVHLSVCISDGEDVQRCCATTNQDR